MKHSKKVTTSFTTVLNPLPARSVRGCGHALSALAMIATVVVAVQSAPADQIFADWDADNCDLNGCCDVGFWNDIICWGAEPIPFNGNMGHTYVAGISDGNAEVTLNFNITLDGLIIFGGDSLNTMIIPTNRFLNIVGGPIGGGSTGSIVMDGVLLMQSASNNNFTDLRVTGSQFGSTLRINNTDGFGEIRMSDHINNRILGLNGETIIFGSGLTVSGSGQIGANLTTLINEGTIVADQKTRLSVDPDAGGMINSGLMVARDGGDLRLHLANYDNALGEIRAEDGSTVRFDSGVGIFGGQIVAQSGGLLTFRLSHIDADSLQIDVGGTGQIINDSTIFNLTNHGVFIHNGGRLMNTFSQMTNTGTYFLNSVGEGSLTDIRFVGNTVLDGGGTLIMSNQISNRIYGSTGTQIFTNVDNTIRGSGNIGLNLMSIINQGTIIADQSNVLRIDPNSDGFTNSGTLRAENGATLRIDVGPFTTSGFVFAETGSIIRRIVADYIQTAGSTIIDGALTLNAGQTVTLNGGVLGGSGQINAHVNNVAGTASPGSSVGTLTVNGNYTQGNNASFAVEIAGSMPGQYDVLAINGNATLAGTLEVTFIDGFDPLVGQMFTILTANSVSGVFDNVNSCAGLSVTYNTTSVVLTITAECPPCPADFDNSGAVDVKDMLFLLGAWGPCPPKGDCLADFDLSGDVGVKDLLFLLGAWGPCP